MEKYHILTTGAREETKLWLPNGEELESVDSQVHGREDASAGAAAFNHSCKVVATGGIDGTIVIVGLETGARLPPLIHGEEVTHICFSATSRYLCAASRGLVKVWDLKQRHRSPVLEYVLDAGATSVSFDLSQERLVVCLESGAVLYWSRLSDKGAPLVVEGKDKFTVAGFLSQESVKDLVVTVSKSGAVAVWDVSVSPWSQWWEVPESGHHRGGGVVIATRSTSRGELGGSGVFATAGDDGVLNVFSARRKRHLFQFQLTCPLTAVDFWPDGERIVVGDVDGIVRVLASDEQGGGAQLTHRCHRGPIGSLQVSRVASHLRPVAKRTSAGAAAPLPQKTPSKHSSGAAAPLPQKTPSKHSSGAAAPLPQNTPSKLSSGAAAPLPQKTPSNLSSGAAAPLPQKTSSNLSSGAAAPLPQSTTSADIIPPSTKSSSSSSRSKKHHVSNPLPPPVPESRPRVSSPSTTDELSPSAASKLDDILEAVKAGHLDMLRQVHTLRMEGKQREEELTKRVKQLEDRVQELTHQLEKTRGTAF